MPPPLGRVLAALSLCVAITALILYLLYRQEQQINDLLDKVASISQSFEELTKKALAEKKFNFQEREELRRKRSVPNHVRRSPTRFGRSRRDTEACNNRSDPLTLYIGKKKSQDKGDDHKCIVERKDGEPAKDILYGPSSETLRCLKKVISRCQHHDYDLENTRTHGVITIRTNGVYWVYGQVSFMETEGNVSSRLLFALMEEQGSGGGTTLSKCIRPPLKKISSSTPMETCSTSVFVQIHARTNISLLLLDGPANTHKYKVHDGRAFTFISIVKLSS